MIMRSEAKKAADRRYEAKRQAAGIYKVLGCKVPTELAEQFKRACEEDGTTVNAALTAAVEAYLAARK